MGNSRFPLFVDLTGRTVVVVGGGAVGLRRAEILRRFGAEVTVVSPRLSAPAPGVRHIPRAYRDGDLAGAFLALAATDDSAVNAAVGGEARRRGILFNRADCPEACGFFFPAVCQGDGLTAGVVGDGSDHRKTARIAKQIRAVLSRQEPYGEEKA